MFLLKVGSSGSSGNCYSLEENGKILLMDAGIDIKSIKKLINWKVQDVVCCFCSHVHKDHSLSVSKIENMGIPVFQPYKDENQTFKKDGFFMKSFPLEHDGVENRGVFIMTPSGEKIVYAIDFEFIRFNFKKLGINHFILECNHLDEVDKEENEANFAHVLRGHCALSTLKEFLRVNQTDKLRTVILTHLSETNGDPVIMKDEIQKVVGDKVQVYVARKGMKIQI